MKTQEELTAMTAADASGTLYERKVSAEIEKAAMAVRVGRQLVKINRELVNSEGIEVLIPMRGTLDATVGAEGTTMTLQTPSYDSVSISVQVLEAGVEIGNLAQDASKIDIINDQLENLAETLADKEDVDIIRALCSYTVLSSVETILTGDSSETTCSLSNANILEVVEVIQDGTTLTTEYIVNYKDGLISLSTAPSTGGLVTADYAYAASVTCIEPATAGVLNDDALTEAINNVRAAKRKPDTLIIHPDQERDILRMDGVMDASKFGSAEAILNGLVAKVRGLEVFVTTNCPKGVAIVFDRKKAAALAIKRDVWTVVEKGGDFVLSNTTAVVARIWSKAGLINTDAVCVITNCQSNALIA